MGSSTYADHRLVKKLIYFWFVCIYVYPVMRSTIIVSLIIITAYLIEYIIDYSTDVTGLLIYEWVRILYSVVFRLLIL